MCVYLSKSEDECSLAMTQALRDAFEKDLDKHEQMKSVANVYLNKRVCSVQECVYHILPRQWLRKATAIYQKEDFVSFSVKMKFHRYIDRLRSMPITCFLCITHLETRMT